MVMKRRRVGKAWSGVGAHVDEREREDERSRKLLSRMANSPMYTGST